MSDVFIAGTAMPEMSTRAGGNNSPSLVWTNLPVQTQELAVIMSDPDAPRGEFIHWVAYKVPPSYRYLPAGLPQQSELPDGIFQGHNDFGRTGYDGPAPPPADKPHRYVFRIYALDAALDIQPGISADQLRDAMDGHILDVGEMVGIYGQ